MARGGIELVDFRVRAASDQHSGAFELPKPDAAAVCTSKGGLVVASNGQPGFYRIKFLISFHRGQDRILYVNSISLADGLHGSPHQGRTPEASALRQGGPAFDSILGVEQHEAPGPYHLAAPGVPDHGWLQALRVPNLARRPVTFGASALRSTPRPAPCERPKWPRSESPPSKSWRRSMRARVSSRVVPCSEQPFSASPDDGARSWGLSEALRATPREQHSHRRWPPCARA